MIEIPYYYGNCPICRDTEHNLFISVFTDLPIWNFRVYNNIYWRNATKMLRFMLTEPTIIHLYEPNKWKPTKEELQIIDKLAGEHWKGIILGYNNELAENDIKIPLNLVKPDYTKTLVDDFEISGYMIRLEE